MFRIAVEVHLDIALVLVDVARLPVPVGPLGQYCRQRARRAQEAAQARRRRAAAEQVQAQRPGRRPRGDLDLVAELEARAVPDRLEPRRPAARGDCPRHRGVIALRDAALVEHVGRAVRPGVTAVRAEPHGAAGLVDVQPVARAEPGHALLRVARPRERQPAHGPLAVRKTRVAAQLEHDVVGTRLRDLQLRAHGVEVERVADRLGRDHALRPLHEVVVDLAVADPRLDRAEQAPAVAADGHPVRGDLDLEPRHHGIIGSAAANPSQRSQDDHAVLARWSRIGCKARRNFGP